MAISQVNNIYKRGLANLDNIRVLRTVPLYVDGMMKYGLNLKYTPQKAYLNIFRMKAGHIWGLFSSCRPWVESQGSQDRILDGGTMAKSTCRLKKIKRREA